MNTLPRENKFIFLRSNPTFKIGYTLFCLLDFNTQLPNKLLWVHLKSYELLKSIGIDCCVSMSWAWLVELNYSRIVAIKSKSKLWSCNLLYIRLMIYINISCCWHWSRFDQVVMNRWMKMAQTSGYWNASFIPLEFRSERKTISISEKLNFIE